MTNRNLNKREATKEIAYLFAYSYLCTSLMVVQETVFHALLILLRRKCCSGVSLSIQNLPEKRIRMIQSNYELELLSDNSNDIFKNNIIDIDRNIT